FAQLFLEQPCTSEAARLFADQCLGYRRVVDEQTLVAAVAHLVARQANHSLDVIDVRIAGVTEHHHVATLRIADFDDLGVHHRQANPIGELVDQDEIAHFQRRDHRAGRYLERLDEERTQHQHYRQNRKEGLAVLDEQRLLVQRFERRLIDAAGAPFIGLDRSPPTGREEQQVSQRKRTAYRNGNHQQQRKIDRHISYLPSTPRGMLLAEFR